MDSTQSASPLQVNASAQGFAGRADLCARVLSPEDLAQWSALRDDVLAQLPNPDYYVREDNERDFFLQHCVPYRTAIGVFHAHTLVAYAMLSLIPADDPGHLGLALGMDEADRGSVAHLASCMVRPDWRGLGLQRALLAERLSMAQSHGRHLCLAAVSLHNHSSRHNMLRLGMHIAWAGDLNGLVRQITRIDLHSGLSIDAGDERLVDSRDLAAQRQAFADGYVGVGEMRLPEQVCLRFARRQGQCALSA